MSEKLELNIRTKTKGPMTMKMNLRGFELFIKTLPNIEKQYYSMVKDLMKNTAMGEKETKVLVASQLLEALNRAMPKEAPEVDPGGYTRAHKGGHPNR